MVTRLKFMDRAANLGHDAGGGDGLSHTERLLRARNRANKRK